MFLQHWAQAREERPVTRAAEELLREAEIPQRDKKRLRDSFAALVLLRDWLDSGEPRAAR